MQIKNAEVYCHLATLLLNTAVACAVCSSRSGTVCGHGKCRNADISCVLRRSVMDFDFLLLDRSWARVIQVRLDFRDVRVASAFVDQLEKDRAKNLHSVPAPLRSCVSLLL